jgi:hypothetical protein
MTLEKIFAALPSFDVKIYLDLYEACSFSNVEVCEFCDLMLGVGMLDTIGRLCMCLYPHSHVKPIILPPRFIFCHFLALHWMFRL